MARRRRPVVSDAGQDLDRFKVAVMRNQGYRVDPSKPDSVKYEVAKALGIPFSKGYNGQLTTEDAGKIGGQIGGTMVREMIRLAEQRLIEQQRQ